MIDPTLIPSWDELYGRMGGPLPRRRRAQCLIHGGDSPVSVSLDHDRGLYYCHVCGAGGDRIDWIMRALDTDCAGALRWLGITPGRPPAPDPERVRRQRIRAGLRLWARTRARELRGEHYIRCATEQAALRLLWIDPDDEQAWDALAWALTGIDAIAYQLDMLEGGEEQQIEMYRYMRAAA